MDDLAKTVNEHATQIVLINRDIKQLSDNFVSIMSKLDEIKGHERTVTTLQAILDSYERRLSILEREYADFRTFSLNIQNDMNNKMQVIKDTAREQQSASSTDIIKKLDDLSEKFDNKFDEKEERIRALENWRWYVLGIVFAVAFFLSGVPWKVVLN